LVSAPTYSWAGFSLQYVIKERYQEDNFWREFAPELGRRIYVDGNLKNKRIRAVSSVGRAPRSQRGGRGFESLTVHHSFERMRE
jgi:hypothetical protein